MNSVKNRKFYSPGVWCLALAFMFGMIAGIIGDIRPHLLFIFVYITGSTGIFALVVKHLLAGTVQKWLSQKVITKIR
jgi:hypothetical protein